MYKIRNSTLAMLEIIDINGISTQLAPGQVSVFALAFSTAQALTRILGSSNVTLQMGSGIICSDYSSGKPSLPNVGSNFSNSGIYATFVLVSVVPANPARAMVALENNSGDLVVIIRDDGYALAGTQPKNATLFPINGGLAGEQGGTWYSYTFKGRLQIYARVSGAQIAVMED